MSATAAVFSGPGLPLELRTFSLPTLREGEGLVELTCCTLCGSDLHTIHGKRSVETPTILGHEMVGRLTDLKGSLRDASGSPLIPGDRVSWCIAASCGDCFYCRHELPQKCEKLFKYGHLPIDERHPLSGGMATHCHLAPGTALVKVPENLPDAVASPANCATATVSAALRSAGDCNGTTVLVYGAGMLGLTTCAMAKWQGAARVVMSDLSAERASRALDFGADSLLEPGTKAETMKERERGFDLAFDMSGSPDAIENAISQLRIGGRLILVGSVFPARPLAVRADDIVRKLLRIEGVHNYAPRDLVSAFEFLEQCHERFPFASLIEKTFPLAQAQEAVEQAASHSLIRVALLPKPGEVPDW